MGYSGIWLNLYVSLTRKIHLVHHTLLRTLFLRCPCRQDCSWETALAVTAAQSWPPFPWELTTFSPIHCEQGCSSESRQRSGGHHWNNTFGTWLLPSLLWGAPGFAMNHSNSPSWGYRLCRIQGCALDSTCPGGSTAPALPGRTPHALLHGVEHTLDTWSKHTQQIQPCSIDLVPMNKHCGQDIVQAMYRGTRRYRICTG